MKKHQMVVSLLFIIALVCSYFFNNSMLLKFRENWFHFFKTMILLVPAVLFLTSLFDVWVPRETIEKHLGKNHSLSAYLWMILLASSTVGGLMVALPVALGLFQKGAHLRIIYSYLGFACICRLPMTLYEITNLGLQFTLVRWLISIPLVIVSSSVIAHFASDLKA